MGAIQENVSLAVDRHDGEEWLVLTLSRGGNGGYHHGLGLGLMVDYETRVSIPAALMEAAEDGANALGDAIDALPTLTAGPFPSVVPSTWWAGLTSAQQEAVQAHLQARRDWASLV